MLNTLDMQFTEITQNFREVAEAALVLQGYVLTSTPEKVSLKLPMSLFEKVDEL